MTAIKRRARDGHVALRAALAAVLVAAGLAIASAPAGAHSPHDPITHVVTSPEFAENELVFVISENRIMRSTDGGSSWQEVMRGISASPHARFAIAPSDHDVMYVTTRGEGVLKSTDQGLSWAPTNTDSASALVAEIAVSPDSPDTVFVSGSRDGLFRTTDGGEQWSKVGGPFSRVTALTMANAGQRVIVGDAGGHVWYSDDGGTQWSEATGTPVSNGADDPITAILATDGSADGSGKDEVFAGTDAATMLLRSSDGGESFATVGDGLPAGPVNSIKAVPEADDEVWVSMWHSGAYRSTDNGDTFERSGNGLKSNHQAGDVGVADYRHLAIAKGGDGTTVYFMGGFDGLFRSDDAGANWRELQTQSEYLTGLDVSPDYANDETVVVMSYIKGAYMSENGGETFDFRSDGLETEELGDGNEYAPVRRLHNVVFSPDYAEDGTIFSAAWPMFLKSTDRGRSWEQIQVSPPPPDTPLRQFVIAVSPGYAEDGTIFLGSRQGDIYKSTARGDDGTWEKISNVPVGAIADQTVRIEVDPILGIRSLLLHPQYPERPELYVSTGRGVFHSVDGGSTWTPTGPTEVAMLSMSPEYPTDGTVYAGTGHGLSVTRDSGVTWSLVDGAPFAATSDIEAVAVAPDSSVFVSVLGEGLYRSTDDGRTFDETGTGLIAENMLIADFTNPTSQPIQFSPTFAEDETMFAIAQQDIVKSTDAGATWETVELPSGQEYLDTVSADTGAAPQGDGVESDGGSSGLPYILALAGAVGVMLLGAILWSRPNRELGTGETGPHDDDAGPDDAASPPLETTSGGHE